MISVTTLTPETVEGIFLVEQACFSTPWSLESFQNDLTNENAVYFCIEDAGKVIGYVGMWQSFGEGNINNIAVLPEYRRKGYGKLLLEYLVAYGREHNFSFLTLEVRESNQEARSLYRSVGFLEVGRRKKYYERTEDAILMTLTF
ncbi:MAG: ribosomal protein S18-alanine N-acetyltransferase [Clostridia bacterium]|nr:ribosomal protein S18-alanine N-acetyltransferase [Clostridia bacterium]